MRFLVLALLLAPGLALAQARRVETRPTSETIGTWVLSCAADPMTDRGDCTLRHRLWLEEPRTNAQAGRPQSSLEPGRPGLALEVVQRGGQAVPAIVARNLTMDSARFGLFAVLASAQLRFGREAPLDLPCALEGLSMVCAPRPDQAALAAQQLLAASTVLVRVSGAGAGTDTLALDLAGTRDAIGKLRARAPEPPPVPGFAPGAEIRSLFEQLFRGGVGGGTPAPPAN